MPKSYWPWYVAGALVAALPALVSVESRLYSFGLLGVGWLMIMVGLWRHGPSRPSTAVTLLLVTNIAFWVSFGLWRLRPQLIGPLEQPGLDPFSLAVSVWLLAFLASACYEAFILIRGLSQTAERQISYVGLAGVALQVPLTIRVIYSMIQGV